MTKFAYYPNGRLGTTTQIGPNGEEITTQFFYDPAGRLSVTIDPAGVSRYFGYDTRGNQVLSYFKWDDPATQAAVDKTIITQTIYDDENRVTGTKQYTINGDFAGTVAALENLSLTPDWTTSTTYNSAGQVVAQEDRFGAITYTLYDARGNAVETRTPTKDALGNPRWLVSRTFYDANGRATVTMDPIVVANSLAPTDEGFSFEDDDYDTVSADYRVSWTIYDPAGRVIESRRLQGVGITIEAVDEYEEATVPIYSTDFDPPTESEPIELAAAILSRNETIYDSVGRVSQTITYDTADDSNPFDTVLNRTWFEYDAAGRQTAVVQEVDLDQDDTIETTDANEDGVPDGGEELVRTTTTYDAAGQVKSSTDARGNTTWFEYDQAGRQTAVIGSAVPVPDTNDFVHPRTETVYDTLGRRTKLRENLTQTNPIDATTMTSSGVRETVYGYDEQGRLTDVWLPTIGANSNGSTTGTPHYQYDYDVYGNQVEIKDPNNHSTTFTYDWQGRQLTRKLPDNVLTETMHYSDAPLNDLLPTPESSVAGGQLEYSVDFQGRVTAYRYDNTAAGGGRVVAKYFYDEIGDYDPESPTTDSQQRIFYAYDALGRVTTITDSAFATATTQTYDADGRLTQIDSPQGVINYAYNRLGQLERTWTSHGASGQDLANAITDTSYAYDAPGRLKSVTVTERNDDDPIPVQDQEVTRYRYDANGNLDLEIRTGGVNGDVVTDYEYDALNRLDFLVNFIDGNDDGDFDAGETRLGQYEYTLRTDGQRQRVLETDDQGNEMTFDWVYDELGRLVEESFDIDPFNSNFDYITRYGFDLAGNRTRKEFDKYADGYVNETTDYLYDANDRLTRERFDAATDKTTFYSYTGTQQTGQKVYNGLYLNEPQSGATKTTTLVYDVQGRLKSVSVAEGGTTTLTTYKYNHEGVRVEQSVSTNGGAATTTVYHIDPLNQTGYSQVLEEGIDDGDGRLEAGEIDRSYTIGHTVIAQQTPDLESGATMCLLKDGHGSTRVLVYASGEVLQSYYYDAYGNAYLFDPADAFTHLLYNTEWFEVTTGMQYLRARWYQPTTGRFPTWDPFVGNSELPMSFHKYLYASGNPEMRTDPTGMSDLLTTIAVAGIKAGLVGVAFGLPFHAYRAYQEAAAGANWRDIVLGIMEGVATDFAVGAVLGGGAAGLIRQLGSNAFKLRAVGQSIGEFTSARIPGSVWRLADSARGLGIEKRILNRAAGFLGQQIKNFPVIDDYIVRNGRGIATSVKSLDLTATTYQSASGLRSALNRYARSLQNFVQDTSKAVPVGAGTANPIDEKVLVLAFEEGAATSAQAGVLTEWLQAAATKFPDVKIVFQFVP